MIHQLSVEAQEHPWPSTQRDSEALRQRIAPALRAIEMQRRLAEQFEFIGRRRAA